MVRTEPLAGENGRGEYIMEPVGEPESGQSFQRAQRESRMHSAITFMRAEPTKFVLLVARTGLGTGTVVGTESFKPSGAEWATEQDLRDAGYVPASTYIPLQMGVGSARRTIQELQQELRRPVSPGDASSLRGDTEQVLDRLRERIRALADQIDTALREGDAACAACG